MKKIFVLATALFLCCTAFAAGKGVSVAATNVFSDKFLGTMSDGYEVSTLTYNSQSQLVSVKSVDGSWVETTTFDYTGGTMNGTAYDVKMVCSSPEETMTLYITVGDNLFATYVYQETVSEYDGNSTETWRFEYNSDGQLVKMIRSEGNNEVTTITYINGDIVKVDVVDDDQGDYSTNISYTNAVNNVSGIMLFDMNFGIDMDEMGIAYFAGLLGKPTKQLPVSRSRGDGDNESFTWTIDNNGYPSSLVDNYDGDVETLAFTWTDCAGIESIASDSTKYPIEYYNLQGIRIEVPSNGFYIVKNSDGSTVKVLMK